jgi:hypothetical protein
MIGAFLALAVSAGCRGPARGSERLDVQVMEGADRRSSAEPVRTRSPVFDGAVVRLRAARGETVGLTVWHRGAQAVRVRMGEAEGEAEGKGKPSAAAVEVRGFEVQWHRVLRPSTTMYGGSRGAAEYPDGLIAAEAPSSDPAYFDLTVSSDAAPGVQRGELHVGARRFGVELTVVAARLPSIEARPWVWAYYDPRELAWQSGLELDSAQAFLDEQRCAAMFRAHGVLATPELTPDEWLKRRALVDGARYVPVMVPSEPDELRAAAAFWSAAMAERDQLAFGIPIDEPRSDARRREVREIGERLRAARAGLGAPARLLLAVTDVPRAIYGDAVDIFISPKAISRSAPTDGGASTAAPSTAAPSTAVRWTYNGNPPHAGSMVLDAGNADLRTWGWIGWRWNVPLWYVWDALYWHDRHNAKRAGLPRPGRALDPADAVTFDDGEDHGNFDGVLALPGPADEGVPCLPTLRLKALRRGLQDRQLLEAASCTADSRRRAAEIAASLVPFALADASSASWQRPISPERWAEARSQLLDLASACQPE